LGWDVLALVKGPTIVQFLPKKGLREKNASLTYPFGVSEKLFLDKFIKPFKEESSDSCIHQGGQN
jgi:hypothetical protein